MTDPASLENLRDIVELPPVSMWPQTAGWQLLGLISVLILIVLVYRAIRRWQRDAYRRAALRELETLSDIGAISRLLKRVALVAYPRTDVASLSGQSWCQWLSETSGLTVDDSVRSSLKYWAFDNSSHGVGSQTASQDLAKFAKNWIRKHERKVAC